MKNILLVCAMFIAITPAFAFTYNHQTKIKPDGTLAETVSFDGVTATLRFFKVSVALTSAKVWISNPAAPLFQGAAPVGVNHSLKNTRAASLSFSGSAPATGAEVPITITLDYSLAVQDAHIAFSATTDHNGSASKAGKIMVSPVQCTGIYSSHSFKHVTIQMDDVVVFSGAIKAAEVYNIKAVGSENWTVTVAGGDVKKKFMFFMQYDPNGVMGGAEDRKNFTHKMETTTDANGDCQVKDQPIDTEGSAVQVHGLCTSLVFEKITIMLDGKPVIPKEVVEIDGGKHYVLNVKLAPGVHNIGVIAEGGEATKNAVFTFMCRE